MKTYDLLESGETRRLGDKSEYFYNLQVNTEGSIAEITGAIKEVLDKEGISAKEAVADPRKLEKYEHIRRQVGLTASRKQEDVLLFIEEILKTIKA